MWNSSLCNEIRMKSMRECKFQAWQQKWKCILCENHIKPHKRQISKGVACERCEELVHKPTESLKMGERNVSNDLKNYVAYRDKYTCQKCKLLVDISYEIDHIIPLHRNGSNKATNLMLLCSACHSRKSYLENMNIVETKDGKFVSAFFCS